MVVVLGANGGSNRLAILSSRPWGPRVKVIRKEDLRCLECMTFHCPLPDHPCMTALDVEVLWRALIELMETS